MHEKALYLLHGVLMELMEVEDVDSLLGSQDEVLIWGERMTSHPVTSHTQWELIAAHM